MTHYLLNTPALTAFGEWRYQGPLSLSDAKAFLRAAPFVSAIGHASTAAYLQGILGIPVLCERQAVILEPGDQALVFQLLERLPEGIVLDPSELQRRRSTFGILERLS